MKQFFLPIVMFTTIFFASCGNKYTRVENIPQNKAVVYFYNNTQALTEFTAYIYADRNSAKQIIKAVAKYRKNLLQKMALRSLDQLDKAQKQADICLEANRYKYLYMSSGTNRFVVSVETEKKTPMGIKKVFDLVSPVLIVESGKSYYISISKFGETTDKSLRVSVVDIKTGESEIADKIISEW